VDGAFITPPVRGRNLRGCVTCLRREDRRAWERIAYRTLTGKQVKVELARR